jgi:D-glycero-D-manno-heptose 1,7-bisphosphate phosphatase
LRSWSDAASCFLDRDGTLIEEVNWLSSPSQVRLLPGVPEALVKLRDLGFLSVVITNQSAIARGMLTERGLQDVHAEMGRQLEQEGASVDAIYYCPHHPEVGNPPYRCVCECRKPESGMLEQAARDLDIDLSRSYMIGDKLSDIEAGWNAGCKSILVLTGYGREVRDGLGGSELERISYIAEDLWDAARWIGEQE